MPSSRAWRRVVWYKFTCFLDTYFLYRPWGLRHDSPNRLYTHITQRHMQKDAFASWGVETTSKLLLIQPASQTAEHTSLAAVVCSAVQRIVGCLLSYIMPCSLNCKGRGEEIASDSRPISEVTSEGWGGVREVSTQVSTWRLLGETDWDSNLYKERRKSVTKQFIIFGQQRERDGIMRDNFFSHSIMPRELIVNFNFSGSF